MKYEFGIGSRVTTFYGGQEMNGTIVGRHGTVGELMEYLAEFDEDVPIYLRNDGGYTYGSINEHDLSEEFYDEE